MNTRKKIRLWVYAVPNMGIIWTNRIVSKNKAHYAFPCMFTSLRVAEHFGIEKDQLSHCEITLITKKGKLNNGGPSLKEVVATPEFQKKLKEFRQSFITKKKVK